MNVLWLLGTCLGALQCQIQEVGKPGRSPQVRKGTWGCQSFGFGRNQPHQHLLLGSGSRGAACSAQDPALEPRPRSSAWSVCAHAPSKQAL